MTENQAKKRARVVPVVVRPKWITELKSLANLESRGENKHKLYYRYIGLNKEVISGSPEYWDATTGRFSAPFNEFRKELIDDAIGFVYDNLDDAESELVMVRQLDDMVLSFLIMDIPPESPAQHAACIENNHYVYLTLFDTVLTHHTGLTQSGISRRMSKNIVAELMPISEMAKQSATKVSQLGCGGIGERFWIQNRHDEIDLVVQNQGLVKEESQARSLELRKMELVVDKDWDVREKLRKLNSWINGHASWEAGDDMTRQLSSVPQDQHGDWVKVAIDHYRTACNEAEASDCLKLVVRCQAALAGALGLIHEKQRAVELYKSALHTAKGQWEEVDVYCPEETEPFSRTDVLQRQQWFRVAEDFVKDAAIDAWVRERDERRAAALEECQDDIAAIHAAAVNPRYPNREPTCFSNIAAQLSFIYENYPPQVAETPTNMQKKQTVEKAFNHPTGGVEDTVARTIKFMKYFYSYEQNTRNDLSWQALCHEITLILNGFPMSKKKEDKEQSGLFPKMYVKAEPKNA